MPCAWRFPGVGTALAGALFLHRRLTVQSRGTATREVDWAQSSALMVRREAAAEVDYLDPAFFVYYDECDFARRLADAGWHSLFVPAAEAVHHDQLSTDLARGLPRIVEFHRNRDLYMRRHHSAARGPGRPCPHRLVLRGAGDRRHLPAKPTRPDLLGPRRSGAPAEARRVDPRSRLTARRRASNVRHMDV